MYISVFEMILLIFLVPFYGCVAYVAGKANILELIIKIVEEKLKEMEKVK